MITGIMRNLIPKSNGGSLAGIRAPMDPSAKKVTKSPASVRHFTDALILSMSEWAVCAAVSCSPVVACGFSTREWGISANDAIGSAASNNAEMPIGTAANTRHKIAAKRNEHPAGY